LVSAQRYQVAEREAQVDRQGLIFEGVYGLEQQKLRFPVAPGSHHHQRQVFTGHGQARIRRRDGRGQNGD
jgi:hypothetical protein